MWFWEDSRQNRGGEDGGVGAESVADIAWRPLATVPELPALDCAWHAGRQTTARPTYGADFASGWHALSAQVEAARLPAATLPGQFDMLHAPVPQQQDAL